MFNRAAAAYHAVEAVEKLYLMHAESWRSDPESFLRYGVLAYLPAAESFAFAPDRCHHVQRSSRAVFLLLHATFLKFAHFSMLCTSA